MKGYIYVLRSHKTTDVYYGSTKEELSHRLSSHKRSYNVYLKKKRNYLTAYEILKYDDVYIELIEEVQYENKLELNIKENEYIRTNACINKNGKGDYTKYYIKYYSENREKFLAKNKIDYEKRKLNKVNSEITVSNPEITVSNPEITVSNPEITKNNQEIINIIQEITKNNQELVKILQKLIK